jgi:hypothetical protein
MPPGTPPRDGLASGSARSRRPVFGPCVTASRDLILRMRARVSRGERLVCASSLPSGPASRGTRLRCIDTGRPRPAQTTGTLASEGGDRATRLSVADTRLGRSGRGVALRHPRCQVHAGCAMVGARLDRVLARWCSQSSERPARHHDRACAELPATGAPNPLAPTICSISLRSGQLGGGSEAPMSHRHT